MNTPAEYAFLGTLSFVLLVAGVGVALLWWQTFVNPKFPSRGLPTRVDDQETRIIQLETRVAAQEAQLETLRLRVAELSDQLTNQDLRDA